MRLKSKNLFLSLSLVLTFQGLSQKLQAQTNEVGDGLESSIRPRPRPTPPPLAPDKSASPLARPIPFRELIPPEIAKLKSQSCPGTEYCPGLPSRAYSPLCSEYIDANGNYGETGLQMLEAMQDIEKAHSADPAGSKTAQCSFFENIDLGSACPNYKYLTALQKQHVWVWMWATIAQTESSCDPNVDARGIFNEKLGRYEVADGLNGLEQHFDSRVSNARDARFCPHDEVKDTKNLYFQTRCSASIMFDTNCNTKTSIVNDESYWQQLQYSTRKVPQFMQRHPLCKIIP